MLQAQGTPCPNAAFCIAHLALAKPGGCTEHPPLCGPGSPSHVFSVPGVTFVTV